MKNQYFGDINDYKKYGLLRAIIDATDFTVLVNWMLTPNDDGPDGKKTAYLQEPDRFSHYDPELFAGLYELVAQQGKRFVGALESTNLLPNAEYFSLITPDESPKRSHWFGRSMDCLDGVDFVFLDPDNGLEVSSRPYGQKSSSKYLYWQEVRRLWSVGKSLLIYQHFIREKRETYIQRRLVELENATPGSLVEAFSTANVVFLMALQPQHGEFHAPILEAVQQRWPHKIRHWDLVKDSPEEYVDTFTIDQVLDALNTQKIRATYQAVASVIGEPPGTPPSHYLGKRRPYASWVVREDTRMPTGYSREDRHPELRSNSHVIDDAAELINLIKGK